MMRTAKTFPQASGDGRIDDGCSVAGGGRMGRPLEGQQTEAPLDPCLKKEVHNMKNSIEYQRGTGNSVMVKGIIICIFLKLSSFGY